MNELTPAQERYMVFVKELVNEGLNRVERMLGVDGVGADVAIEAIAQPSIAAPTAPLELPAAAKRRKPYKKQAKIGRPHKKAVVVEEVGTKPAPAPAPLTNRPCGCSARGAHRKSCQHSNWPVAVSVPAPAQSDGLIRSGQRMPSAGVPAGFAECRCGRIRKPDEQVCVVCSAMRMKRPA